MVPSRATHRVSSFGVLQVNKKPRLIFAVIEFLRALSPQLFESWIQSFEPVNDPSAGFDPIATHRGHYVIMDMRKEPLVIQYN